LVVSGKIWEGVGPQRRRATVSGLKAANSLGPREPIDFGWRLRGRTIRLLRDSSLTLLPVRQRATADLLAQYCGDRNSLLSCLQCGVCTVNCHLAGTDGALFPRRQMTLLQLGEVDKLLADPSVWLCFNCQDCTSRCPDNAGPGRIMAALRRLAVEQNSVPRWSSRLASQRRGFLCMLLVAIALLVVAIAVGGSFSPQSSPVRYASMLPHLTLNLFFGTLAGVVMMFAAINTARAWKAFTGESLWEAHLGRLAYSLSSATRQIFRHRQFSECQQFPLSRWAHIFVFYGFITLLALAGAAATLIALGAPYPLPVFHPFKIAGNLAAVAIIVGTLYFCVERRRPSQDRDSSSWFDWAPLVQLLLVSMTGLLAEVFRYANVDALAYPTYFLHLAFVFVLLAGTANSKLAHVFYRTVALIAQQYKIRSEPPVADLKSERVAA
jgi:quinone-modifying oxidoreductase, subunit QmoC